MILVEKLKQLSGRHIFFILLFIIFGVFVPSYYLFYPLGVDEATYLVIGALIKDGALLYRDVIDVKLPGIYYLAALVFSVAGKSFIAIRVLTYVINAISALLVYSLGKKIANKNIGMAASIFFLIGMYLWQYEGYCYMTEPYVVFFSLLSVLFFLKDGYRAKLVSGLALGMGLFGVFFLFYLLNLRFQKNRTKDYVINSAKNLISISLGVAVPLLLVFLYFFSMGAGSQFTYCTIFFISDYSYPFILWRFIKDFFSFFPIWLLSTSMVLLVGCRLIKGKVLNEKHFLLTLWLLVFSILVIRTGSHRVPFIFPSAAILSALMLSKLYQNLKGRLYFFPFRNYFFFFSDMTPGVKYLGSITGDGVAEKLIEELQINNVSYVVAVRDVIEMLEEKKPFAFHPESKNIMYNYIKENYQLVDTVEYYYLYKLKSDV
jgi:hypothetical protein